MTPRELLQGQRAFIDRQQTGRDFVLQLRAFLDAVGQDSTIREALDALAREAEAHRDAIVTFDTASTARLVSLSNDLRTAFPSPDPPSTTDDPVRPWHWAWFDNLAKGRIELPEFRLPDEQSDPTVAGKLLPFLRGKLQDIVNQVERTGDEAPLERSSPYWDRYNQEERGHEHAVRDFHIQEASHAGWSLRRIDHVARLLTRRPTPIELQEAGGLDFTPWEPVARAVNYTVFGTKPKPPLHFDYNRESEDLVASLRKDVDRLCEALVVRLGTLRSQPPAPVTSHDDQERLRTRLVTLRAEANRMDQHARDLNGAIAHGYARDYLPLLFRASLLESVLPDVMSVLEQDAVLLRELDLLRAAATAADAEAQRLVSHGGDARQLVLLVRNVLSSAPRVAEGVGGLLRRLATVGTGPVSASLVHGERLDDAVLNQVMCALWILECDEHAVQGSAFALADGRVVSCEHVVCEHVRGERAACSTMVAFRPTSPRERHTVRVVHANRDIDLAVLDIGHRPDAGLSVGQPSTLRQMDRLWVAGFPNYRLGDSGYVAPGVVTAFRTVSGIRRILTDALIVAGNSGGPGITSDGKVIGIAVTGADCSEASRTTENYGLIPIDALQHLAVSAK